MPSAEIITIGTELLLGEIHDTNTYFIANIFRNLGIDLFRSTTIGDNQERITSLIKEAFQRSDIIITTGGLGPTVDDPTRLAVANALGVALEFRPELWEQIQTRFNNYGRTPTENNRRQAFIPAGSTAVENLVGTAPAFVAETGTGVVISLPGVPREMEYLMENEVLPFLHQRFNLEHIIKATVIHASGAGESQIDELIGDLEHLSNPTVGLLAHPGQVDIRVTAKAANAELADKMIQPIVEDIKNRLGDLIYGFDETKIEDVVIEQLHKNNQKIAVVENGLSNLLSQKFIQFAALNQQTDFIDEKTSLEKLEKITKNLYKKVCPDPVIAANLIEQANRCVLELIFIDHEQVFSNTYSYGGHKQLAVPWAINLILNTIRINKNKSKNN